MSTPLANQPAFPAFEYTDGHGCSRRSPNDQSWEVWSPGMTLRQHFAAMAMQGMLSNSTLAQIYSDRSGLEFRSDVADKAVKYADALIAALEEKK